MPTPALTSDSTISICGALCSTRGRKPLLRQAVTTKVSKAGPSCERKLTKPSCANVFSSTLFCPANGCDADKLKELKPGNNPGDHPSPPGEGEPGEHSLIWSRSKGD